MSLVSLTQIRKVLRECQFNPKEPGPMKVVAECGNVEYFMTRAIEAIETAKTAQFGTCAFDANMKQAIGLLALALVEAGNADPKTKIKGRSGTTGA